MLQFTEVQRRTPPGQGQRRGDCPTGIEQEQRCALNVMKEFEEKHNHWNWINKKRKEDPTCQMKDLEDVESYFMLSILILSLSPSIVFLMPTLSVANQAVLFGDDMEMLVLHLASLASLAFVKLWM